MRTKSDRYLRSRTHMHRQNRQLHRWRKAWAQQQICQLTNRSLPPEPFRGVLISGFGPVNKNAATSKNNGRKAANNSENCRGDRTHRPPPQSNTPELSAVSCLTDWLLAHLTIFINDIQIGRPGCRPAFERRRSHRYFGKTAIYAASVSLKSSMISSIVKFVTPDIFIATSALIDLALYKRCQTNCWLSPINFANASCPPASLQAVRIVGRAVFFPEFMTPKYYVCCFWSTTNVGMLTKVGVDTL